MYTSSEAYFINLVASFFAIGITNMLVGNTTIKPIIQPLRNLKMKPSSQPVFTIVITNVIVVSKAKVIKKATKIPRNLLEFITINHTLRFYRVHYLKSINIKESICTRTNIFFLRMIKRNKSIIC